MQRLLIHAGIHRTGTTALQRVLADNRAVLREHGVLYPFTGQNHQDIVWDLFHGKLTGPELRDRLLEAAGADISTIVLSGEDFCVHEDLGWMADLRETFDVEVALYLRRQDLWVASWYNQHVKWPFNREKSQASPREFLQTVWEYHWLDYQRLLERWHDAVGAEGLHVAVLDPTEPIDVVTDFGNILEFEATHLKGYDRRVNDGMPVAALEIARHLGMIDLGSTERYMIELALRRAFTERDETTEMIFTPAERRDILDRFAESNAAVAKQYLNRDELFASPVPVDEDPYFTFPDVGHEELMRQWVAPFVHQLVRIASERRKK